MKRGQKGFTLIEILVVVAILGVIAVPLAYTTITLLTNPARSNDENVVLQQVRNVGDWISRDVQMARIVTLDEPGVFLRLDIPKNDKPEDDYTIKYLFNGNRLKREVRDSSTLISETLIADYIDTANTFVYGKSPKVLIMPMEAQWDDKLPVSQTEPEAKAAAPVKAAEAAPEAKTPKPKKQRGKKG
ncbi:hypothetical protein ES705_10135 [subsurface metagenome]